MTLSLDGITAVLVTAYRDGTEHIDTDTITEVAARVATAGVPVLTALGNTAEIQQLDAGERRAVVRAVGEVSGSATLVAGVAGALGEMVQEAEAAKHLGYDAVMAHEPSDPFGDAGGVVELYTQLAERSPLPVILYLRSHRLEGQHIAAAVAHPNVVGVKYARTDMHTLTALMQQTEPGACTWINGLAESQVPAFAGVGVQSFTSGIANARPDVALAVHAAVRAGDLGRLTQLLADFVEPVEALRAKGHGRCNVATIKQMLRWHGIETGGVRPPHAELSEAARDQLDSLRSYSADAAH